LSCQALAVAGWSTLIGRPSSRLSKVLRLAAGLMRLRRQVESIDPGHDPQRRFTHRCGLVIQGGSRQTQQRTLAADAELGMVVIDQLAEFTSIRAAEIFFEPLQLHLQPADLLEQLSLLGLPLVLVLALLPAGEKLAGSIQQLPPPLAHLDRVAPRGALHGANQWRGRRRPPGSFCGH